MSAFVAKILELLFPPYANCLACGTHRIADDWPPLCGDCRDELEVLRHRENVCIRCGHVLLTSGCSFCKKAVTKHLHWMRAAYPHKGAARQLVLRLKHSGVDDAARILAPVMVQAFLNDPPQYPIDVCTFVPMPARRLRYSGANHAQILCREVSEQLSIASCPLLTAFPSKKRQAELTRAQRLKNRKGVYTVVGDVKGLHILLIDDVLTTGATAQECARVLQKSGAASVAFLSAAFA